MKLFRNFLLFLVLGISSDVFADLIPPTGQQAPPEQNRNGAPADYASEIAAMREENKKLREMIESLFAGKTLPPTPPNTPQPENGNDLRDKVARESEERQKSDAQHKDIEKAVAFNMHIDDFVEKNANLLPGEIPLIVKAANKEAYDSSSMKAAALKAALIQSYFSVQSNLDLLTASQRNALEDYVKLTKNGKEQKAAEIYENIFEPAFETMRKVKKAEELSRSRMGFASSNYSNTAYKDKLVNLARKNHLGIKEPVYA